MLMKKLGKGAMGEVYEAKDITLGRHVAIKVMGPKIADDEQAMQDFVREARTLAALNHRNVVQVHSIGVEQKQPYIVMELVNGGRMDNYVAKDQPGDEAALLHIASDTARGLDAAANIGLVHGDVKPANVLIDKNGEAKIVDFGLARFADSTQEGKIYGTPYYIAPELLQGKAADFRSDMYSLGASLFHGLSGRPPFRAPKLKEIVRLRLKQPAPNLRSVVHHIHPETAAVVAKMLEKDPNNRHQNYAELVTELDAALVGTEEGPVAVELADLHEAVASSDRAGRSGNVAGALDSATNSRRSFSARQTFNDLHNDSEGKNWAMICAIGGAVLIGVVALIFFLASGNGNSSTDKAADQAAGSQVDIPSGFTENFDKSLFVVKWKYLDDGGKMEGGVFQIVDAGTSVNGPSAKPGISTFIPTKSISVSVDLKELLWAGGSEALYLNIADANGKDRDLEVAIYNAQGECFAEIESELPTGVKDKTKVTFKSTPKSLKLRVTFNIDTNQWRIRYGLDGDAATTQVGDALNGHAGPSTGRRLELRADQFSTRGKTGMKIDSVKVTSSD